MYSMADRRDEILDAALALASEHGLDAVSMRAVAARIGVTPMALYPAVGGKDALLDGLVERLVGDMVQAGADRLGPSPDRLTWEDVLRGAAYGVRVVARRHPAVVPLLFARPALTGMAVQGVDMIYRTLLTAGVPARQVPRLERLFTTFVIGFAISEVSGRFSAEDPRGRRGAGAPAHTELAEVLAEPPDWDAEFEADLEDLFHLIRATTR